MEETPHYRHELKYLLSYGEYLPIRQRLREVMAQDGHVRGDGTYQIRSIYFDNLQDKALREKLYGVPVREKFRIRYYNDDLSFITLEKKCKRGDLCLKYDAPVTADECRALLAGDKGWMQNHPQPLVRELVCKMTVQQLRPRVLVSYIREPYVYAPGNVRVTFDSDVRTSLYHRLALEGRARDISAMDAPGQIVMEVKYDSFLPDIIARLLQAGTPRQGAFSKYGACRRFG